MSNRVRVLLVLAVAALFIIILSMRGIANFVTDYLWFDAIGFNRVWRTVLFSQIVLAIIFVVIFAVLCWVNLWLADRLGPQYREPSPEEEAVARFREVVGERWGLVRLGVTALFALTVGLSAAAQWRNWLLFTNSVDFGVDDPQFGRDIGFFVFRLPFLTWLAGWFFTALMVILVLTIAMHYLAGGIRIQSLNERVTPQVKAHLSFLLAAMALVRAASYWLDRYALAYSSDGRFAGLSYTDVEARLPVLSLLILIALLSVALFLLNIRRKGWGLPAVAVGLWALVSIVMNGIYPLAIQRLRVDPVETTREAPYIERNIIATKDAFGLGPVTQRTFRYAEDLDVDDLTLNTDILAAVPLLDPTVSARTFELEQQERSFFQFDPTTVDVDRYEIDGRTTQVLIGARELNSNGLPESGWESEVLSFTHGNGVAIAPSAVVENTLPVFQVGDVPVDNSIPEDIPIEQPRIYYGENMGGYAIVDTDRDEVDFIDAGERFPYNYTGEGGVDAGGIFRRALFALRFQSIDILFSDFVRDDSRFVWNRNVRDRVEKVAPFLEFDHNPYPAVVDGDIHWVVDAYTTTSNYPYSQPRNGSGLDNQSGLRGGYNYVRNSVKAVVDAYDGSVTLYIVDETDPLIQAWDSAFPGVLTPFSEMPESLIDNLRYPEDLFTVQTNMWSVYHIDSDETADLLEGSDEWSIAQDPGGVQGADINTTVDAQGQTSRSEVRVRPYYTLLRLPEDAVAEGEDPADRPQEETEQEFVIFRSFVPFSANDAVKEMQAFMVGVSEVGDGNYGRLVSYEIDNVQGDSEAQGPSLIASQISTQENISEEITLLNARDEGSSIEFGDLIVLPIDQSFVYVRPMYVLSTQTKLPNLEWVIVSYANTVVMCAEVSDALGAVLAAEGPIADLPRGDGEVKCVGDGINDEGKPESFSDDALSRLISSAAATDADTSDDEADTDDNAAPPPLVDGTALEQAGDLLARAEQALADGDLGEYQDLVEEATALITAELDGG
ncbi:MAG: UPF0182 family protein [Actinomycetota bacterium]